MITSIYASRKTADRLHDYKHEQRLSSLDEAINHLLDGEKKKWQEKK